MKGIFRHPDGYVRNKFGSPGVTPLRNEATVFEQIEKETVAARLNCRPSELIFEEIQG